LLVGDLAGNSAGSIENFTLEITSSVAEPITTTDSLGRYLFAFAGTGVHQIRQMPVPGYVVANPIGGVHEVVIEVGTEIAGLNFANVTPGVVGRSLFYDASKFDGAFAGISSLDDLAIAADKSAYLPGAGMATFANISSYVRGLNGIMVDVVGLDDAISLDDFQFRTGNDNDPDSWLPAPQPIAMTLRPGAGEGGADRIELVWGSSAVKNAWLQVTLEGNDAWGGFNSNTGLATSDVFYFGSRLGDTGSGSDQVFITNIADELAARANPGINQSVSSLYDFDRNGLVNIGDQLVARMNPGVLVKIDLPGSVGLPLVANAMAAALAIADRENSAMVVQSSEPIVSESENSRPQTAGSRLPHVADFEPDLTLRIEEELQQLAVDDELLDALLG
jgi:hypothetical protein